MAAAPAPEVRELRAVRRASFQDQEGAWPARPEPLRAVVLEAHRARRRLEQVLLASFRQARVERQAEPVVEARRAARRRAARAVAGPESGGSAADWVEEG